MSESIIVKRYTFVAVMMYFNAAILCLGTVAGFAGGNMRMAVPGLALFMLQGAAGYLLFKEKREGWIISLAVNAAFCLFSLACLIFDLSGTAAQLNHVLQYSSYIFYVILSLPFNAGGDTAGKVLYALCFIGYPALLIAKLLMKRRV